MKTPLVPAEEDKRWDFVRNVLWIFEQREVRKIVSKFGIKPLDRTTTALKIVIISMCFETDITFVISELKDKAALREFINWFKKKYTKADLKDKDYKGAYSKSKGYYIGMKLVFAIEYPSLKSLAFLVFPGGPLATQKSLMKM